MLKVRDLNKTFPHGRKVLEDVEFDLGGDETLAVVGPSGCGKTTLLYLICGLISADSPGRVSLNGGSLSRPSPEVAIILQDYGLLPWKTVLDNVALGLKVQGRPCKERRAEAARFLEQVGLSGRGSEYPGRLSGGEQQRVAIARAYAQNPKLLLMDEPFSSLDAITREKLQTMLLHTWRETKVPYILVTHSVEEAVFLGKRILILAGDPARITRQFENPEFGRLDCRDRSDFYKLVREIRKSMEALW